MKRAVLTGAGGDLGSRLAKRLARHDVELVLVARDFERTKAAIQDAGQAVVGGCSCDLASAASRSSALQDEVFDGADVVFHCAADLSFLGSTTQYETNVLATDELYERAADAGVRAFVFTSSVDATGSSARAGHRGVDDYGFHAPYGLSKLLAEERLLAKRRKTTVQIARLGMLVGDDDNLYGGLVALCRDDGARVDAMRELRMPIAPTEAAIDRLIELAELETGTRRHVFETNPTLGEYLRLRGLAAPVCQDPAQARAELRAWIESRIEAGQADLCTYLAWPSPHLAGRSLSQ